MSTVSPELVLGLCILGTCVATIIGYAVSRLLRPKVLNEHEESAEATNPFHEMSREQKDYMGEVRKKNSEDIWERLQVDVKKERQRQRRSAMGIRGGCGGEKGRDVIGPRYDSTGAVYDEIHPFRSGSGRAARYGSAYVNVIGRYEDMDPAFEPRSQSAFLEVPCQNQRRPMSKDSRGSLIIDDWEKRNGAFSMTFESIAGAGTIALNREAARGREAL